MSKVFKLTSGKLEYFCECGKKIDAFRAFCLGCEEKKAKKNKRILAVKGMKVGWGSVFGNKKAKHVLI